MQPYCNNGQPERDITHSRCVHRTLPMRLPENNAPRREPAISIMSRSDVRKHRAGVPRLPIRQLREESVIPVESTRAPPPHHYDSTSSHEGPGVTAPRAHSSGIVITPLYCLFVSGRGFCHPSLRRHRQFNAPTCIRSAEKRLPMYTATQPGTAVSRRHRLHPLAPLTGTSDAMQRVPVY